MLKPVLTAAACLLALASPATADLLWGANGHPITAYPGIAIERQFDYLEDLGMKSYRVNVSDASSADSLATVLAEGRKRGIEVLPVITPGGIDLDKDSVEDLYAKARALAVALGSRFKGEIRTWELGNEMENYAIIKPCEKRDDGTTYPCAWGLAGGADALDYFGPRWAKVSAVLKGLSDGMTEVDPGIRKAIGTAGWGHTGAFERMRRDGVAWDISVWHMYGEDPEPAFKVLARYGKPIWVTEFNNPYGSRSGEQQQAEGLAQSMVRLRALQRRYKVEAAYIYELLDETYWAPDFEASMGLVRLVGSAEQGWRAAGPKAAYVAARGLIRGPQPMREPRRDCDLADNGGIVTFTIRKVSFSHCLILGRKASAEDIERWSAALDEGKVDVPNMMVQLMQTREFMEKYAIVGLVDRAYVRFVYHLLLGREADGAGLDIYSDQLRTGAMTRESVALGLVTSSEFATKYSTYLAENTKAVPEAQAAN